MRRYLARDGRENGRDGELATACACSASWSSPTDTLEAVHVYFPDPWWKARHRKRRVLNEAFLADVGRTLRVGGRLHFWTDVQEYYETTSN